MSEKLKSDRLEFMDMGQGITSFTGLFKEDRSDFDEDELEAAQKGIDDLNERRNTERP